MTDPFGRALREFYHGEQDEPLRQIDGEWERDHPIEAFYFGERTAETNSTPYLERWLDGPMLDVGAGAGRDPLYFQAQFETVAIEVSEHLVETMRERGVDDAREADMFALPESFDRDRFASAHALGTQLGLAGSLHGVREFLSNLAHVTRPDGTAIVDNYDPTDENAHDMLGYRSDPTPGMAHRVMHFEYEGVRGETLYFRLFSPDRLREACVGTPWRVADVRRGPEGNEYHYKAALAKGDD